MIPGVTNPALNPYVAAKIDACNKSRFAAALRTPVPELEPVFRQLRTHSVSRSRSHFASQFWLLPKQSHPGTAFGSFNGGRG